MASNQPTKYAAIVIGAGPGGLATIAALLDIGTSPILWIDETFNGGRLNGLYREISSNTKTGIYLDAIESSSTCNRIIKNTPRPNAVTRLKELPREETCQLALAGDMVQMLVEGIKEFDGVTTMTGRVKAAELKDEGTWIITLPGHRIPTTQLHLCTGSHPIIANFHKQYNPDLSVLDLDRCMIRSTLSSLFPADKPSTVAVIGNSHSGILCCRNLYELRSSKERDVEIINFHRSPIRHAIYREDGIIYDNTGLKGDTSTWAKEFMQSHSDTPGMRQVDLTSRSEEEIYRQELPRCTHIVYAIGYEPNSLPDIYVFGEQVNQKVEFDMQTSGFRISGKDEVVPRLFGAGIAFPERVADPEGNVEAAVGLAKFFKFTERVKDSWGLQMKK